MKTTFLTALALGMLAPLAVSAAGVNGCETKQGDGGYTVLVDPACGRSNDGPNVDRNTVYDTIRDALGK